MRVDAQLIDAQSGAHLSANRFGEDVADLFKLQDQVVARLADTLGVELIKAKAQRDERIAHPDAFDLTMRGRALQMRAQEQRTKENNDAARAMFEQALARASSTSSSPSTEPRSSPSSNCMRRWRVATAGDFLRRLIAAVPYKVHTVLTDNGTHFTTPKGHYRVQPRRTSRRLLTPNRSPLGRTPSNTPARRATSTTG